MSEDIWIICSTQKVIKIYIHLKNFELYQLNHDLNSAFGWKNYKVGVLRTKPFCFLAVLQLYRSYLSTDQNIFFSDEYFQNFVWNFEIISFYQLSNWILRKNINIKTTHFTQNFLFLGKVLKIRFVHKIAAVFMPQFEVRGILNYFIFKKRWQLLPWKQLYKPLERPVFEVIKHSGKNIYWLFYNLKALKIPSHKKTTSSSHLILILKIRK